VSPKKYKWQIGQTPPELDVHSSAKHNVYRYYFRRYIDVLCSDPHHDGLNLTLVDGFAGGGVYLRNGQPASGSPMILLEEIAAAEARFAQQRTKPFRLHAEFIFVERNGANYQFLKDTIRRSQFAAGSIKLVEDTFETALPAIIQRIRSRGRAQRCIFFLDQFGYTQVSFDTVRTILTSLQNPEIILTFAVDHLIDYLSTTPASIEAVKPVELSVQHIQDLISTKDQREARWVIQNFLYAHLINQTRAPYYTCFFIKSPESHRSYWLVHISKHPKARDETALQHWALSNHFVHHGREGLRMLGFDPDRDIDQFPLDFMFDDNAEARSRAALRRELPPLIFDRLRHTNGPPTMGRLFKTIANETPATTKLISKVLVGLREDEEIEIVRKDGRPKPRSTHLEWSDVILPAKQRSLFSRLSPMRLSSWSTAPRPFPNGTPDLMERSGEP
jgi:three-Cys-motif partner protein